MASNQGISFLHEFDLGNRDINNPGVNIIRTSPTAVGDFDKANLTEESIREVWRSADVLTPQEIVIKAEIVSDIDTFAILGHNFTTGAIVRIEANIDDVWVAPPFSVVVTVTEDDNNIVFANDGFGGQYTYYRVTVLDPSNPCGYIQIGRIVGGRAFTFTNNEDIVDNYRVRNVDYSEKMKSQGFFRISNEVILGRELSVNFQKLYTIEGQNTNYIGFKKMFKSVKTTRPFLTILDRDNTATLNLWGQLTQLPSESFGINQFVSFGINIEEVF